MVTNGHSMTRNGWEIVKMLKMTQNTVKLGKTPQNGKNGQK